MTLVPLRDAASAAGVATWTLRRQVRLGAVRAVRPSGPGVGRGCPLAVVEREARRSLASVRQMAHHAAAPCGRRDVVALVARLRLRAASSYRAWGVMGSHPQGASLLASGRYVDNPRYVPAGLRPRGEDCGHDPHAAVERRELARRLLAGLTERERFVVVRMTLGWTLAQVGRALPVPVTRERVRQIQAKALYRMRRAAEAMEATP